MVFHLDTSTAVDLMREAGRGARGPAHQCLAQLPTDALVRISAFALIELWAGVFLARRSQDEEERLRNVLDLADAWTPDPEFARHAGSLVADSYRRGRVMSSFDVLIAAAATSDGAALITRDRDDFAAVPHLKIVSYP
ncbi:MAG: type II toxin-antitoxin system VapC family toxin [Vicinamibacterales bacterium]